MKSDRKKPRRKSFKSNIDCIDDSLNNNNNHNNSFKQEDINNTDNDQNNDLINNNNNNDNNQISSVSELTSPLLPITNNDNIGMHRESFYNRDLYVKHQVNVTVPIMNYSKKNSMKVVCKSHKIPDSKIKTKKISSKESGVKKKSLKHRLGSPYNPKKILSGVNLNSAKRLNIYPGKFCMFSAYLIHGGGTNPTKNIRLSLDFALIKNTKLNNLKVKKQFNSYSADRSYFQKLSTLYK
jgi:hypothetical protein